MKSHTHTQIQRHLFLVDPEQTRVVLTLLLCCKDRGEWLLLNRAKYCLNTQALLQLASRYETCNRSLVSIFSGHMTGMASDLCLWIKLNWFQCNPFFVSGYLILKSQVRLSDATKGLASRMVWLIPPLPTQFSHDSFVWVYSF